MELNNAQKQTMKTYILSQPDLAAVAVGINTDYQALVNLLNADANPATNAWRTDVSVDELDEAPDYSTFDSIAAGKRDSWDFFLRRSRNMTRNKVRKWITDVWGNATANSNAEAILLAGIEKASRAEVALGGNTKTTGTVSGLDRVVVGEFTGQNAAEVMSS